MPSSSSIRRRPKPIRKTVPFNVMVVGASGSGRTTFINTLVNQNGWSKNPPSGDPSIAYGFPVADHTKRFAEISRQTIEILHQGNPIRLTVCETPGFGENIDNQTIFASIISYLENQYTHILAEESRIQRNPRLEDNRVHACLYFIPPTGHSLREMDIELMGQLSTRVNVIPVIGKADSLTSSELKSFKERIMEDIEHYQIPIYNFPFDADEDDDDVIAMNSELRALLPFSIVGSEDEVEVGGNLIRARKYPWGVVEIDNPTHTDFAKLRTTLFYSHMQDLKDITHDTLYENFRTDTLSKGYPQQIDQTNPIANLANRSFKLKEEQLRKDEAKLMEIQVRLQRELSEKRQELYAKEENLRSMEARIIRASNGTV